MAQREPILLPVKIEDLRPTQMTVGFREVAIKRRLWRERAERDGPEFLGRHEIPVLKGPKDKMFVIDHHHLALALEQEGVKEIAVNVLADLSDLKKREFWTFCDNHGWCHPFDDEGVRRDYDAVPTRLSHMKDDLYRSLAGELRRVGGYAKQETPFSEFMWADFLRRRVKIELLEKDFNKGLARALVLSKTREAQHLPGWCGPSADD